MFQPLKCGLNVCFIENPCFVNLLIKGYIHTYTHLYNQYTFIPRINDHD